MRFELFDKNELNALSKQARKRMEMKELPKNYSDETQLYRLFVSVVENFYHVNLISILYILN